MLPLPGIAPGGQRIIINRIAQFDPEKTELVTVNKTHLLFADIFLQEDDRNLICGEYVIVDMKGSSAGHLARFQPIQVKKINKVLEKAYPGRPKGFFFINVPSFFETVNRVMQPFLSEKVKSRVRSSV